MDGPLNILKKCINYFHKFDYFHIKSVYHETQQTKQTKIYYERFYRSSWSFIIIPDASIRYFQ